MITIIKRRSTATQVTWLLVGGYRLASWKRDYKEKASLSIIKTILAIDDRPINLSSMILVEIFVNRSDTCDEC
jgi:hypothetical protein